MKLDVRHTFDCTLDQFWASWWDDGLEQELRAASEIRQEVIAKTENGGVHTVRLRVVLPYDPPRAVKKLIGSDTLSYEQVSTTDQAKGEVRWHIVPPAAPDRVKAEGRVRIHEEGGKVVRHLQGEVTIGIPLIGGGIEQQIAKGIVEGHDQDARIRKAWLSRTFA